MCKDLSRGGALRLGSRVMVFCETRNKWRESLLLHVIEDNCKTPYICVIPDDIVDYKENHSYRTRAYEENAVISLQDNWTTQLAPIIQEYIQGYSGGESLDKDEVDDLVDILKTKINLHQGNITEEEYEELVG